VRRAGFLVFLVGVFVGSCDDHRSASTTTAALPLVCQAAPFTVEARRDGEHPAGDASFTVTEAEVEAVPVVPDRDRKLTAKELRKKAATTPLLTYRLRFSDGTSGGFITVLPRAPGAPLRAGEVVVPGPATELRLFTPASRIAAGLEAPGDPPVSYVGLPTGSVTVVAVDSSRLCLDVDLEWSYSTFQAAPQGVLTLRGMFTAPLTSRSTDPLR
jgi:hypothetical protein